MRHWQTQDVGQAGEKKIVKMGNCYMFYIICGEEPAAKQSSYIRRETVL